MGVLVLGVCFPAGGFCWGRQPALFEPRCPPRAPLLPSGGRAQVPLVSAPGLRLWGSSPMVPLILGLDQTCSPPFETRGAVWLLEQTAPLPGAPPAPPASLATPPCPGASELEWLEKSLKPACLAPCFRGGWSRIGEGSDLSKATSATA